MTIYVDKKNKKFLKVVDDPGAAQDYLDDLKQDNFRFFICDDFVSSDIYDGHDQFVSDLLSLPKETQAQLNKALNKYWRLDEDTDEDDFEDNFRDISDWRDLEFVLDFLNKHVKNFNYWQIRGYCQGDVAYVWTFGKPDIDMYLMDLKSYYPKYSFRDFLTTVIFGSFVDIMKCDQYGNSTDEEMADRQLVADLYIGDSNTGEPNYSDEYVSEYIKRVYNMKVADSIVQYY